MDAHGADRSGQRGEISSWLVQMLVVLAIVGLVVYEAVALGFTAVQVDELAREVARVARDEYRSEESLARARTVAEETAGDEEATVTSFDADEDSLSVTIEKQANTLVVHRIGPLADRLTPSATRRADLRR